MANESFSETTERLAQELKADEALQQSGSVFASNAPRSTGSPLLDAVLDVLDIVGDPLEAVTSGPASSAMSMVGKAFKAGPSTLEDLVRQLARTGEALSPRRALRPAIRVPTTGEVFASEPGGLHPIGVVQKALTQRRTPVPGNLQFGFQQAVENAPFIPEQIAGQLQLGRADVIARALERGTSIDTLIDILKQGRLP